MNQDERVSTFINKTMSMKNCYTQEMPTAILIAVIKSKTTRAVMNLPRSEHVYLSHAQRGGRVKEEMFYKKSLQGHQVSTVAIRCHLHSHKLHGIFRLKLWLSL